MIYQPPEKSDQRNLPGSSCRKWECLQKIFKMVPTKISRLIFLLRNNLRSRDRRSDPRRANWPLAQSQVCGTWSRSDARNYPASNSAHVALLGAEIILVDFDRTSEVQSRQKLPEIPCTFACSFHTREISQLCAGFLARVAALYRYGDGWPIVRLLTASHGVQSPNVTYVSRSGTAKTFKSTFNTICQSILVCFWSFLNVSDHNPYPKFKFWMF